MPSTSQTLNNLAYDLNGVVGCTAEQIATMNAEADALGLVKVAPGVYATKETVAAPPDFSDVYVGDLLSHTGTKIGKFRFLAGHTTAVSEVGIGGAWHDITEAALNADPFGNDDAIVKWLINTYEEGEEEDEADEE